MTHRLRTEEDLVIEQLLRSTAEAKIKRIFLGGGLESFQEVKED